MNKNKDGTGLTSDLARWSVTERNNCVFWCIAHTAKGSINTGFFYIQGE